MVLPDLNLLRLFEAIYRLRNVSRAAEALQMSQPAASQGLTRLRLALGDALFVRAPGGMRPTPRAHRLASVVQAAIISIEGALNETTSFDPASAKMTVRIHMSDIGEARLLPTLMTELRRLAPGIKVQTYPLAYEQIVNALDTGKLDFACGFLPSIIDTPCIPLFQEKYAVVVRRGHPLEQHFRKLPAHSATQALSQLNYVAVRSHPETVRILQQLGLEDHLVLTSAHFLALPEIVRHTDLGVIMPCDIVERFFSYANKYHVLKAELPQNILTVSVYWSRRFEADPVHRWLREFIVETFQHPDLRGLREAPKSMITRGAAP